MLNQDYLKKLLLKYNAFFEGNNRYFYLSFIIVFTCIFFKLPTLSYQAEMWAEAGTNYMYTALYEDVLTNLNTSDFGYLPLQPRLISMLLVKVFGVEQYFPVFSQIIALLFIAFYVSFINLTIFKRIIPGNFIRFILSISIGLFPDYEIFTFLNFSYFGFLICFLLLFIEKDKISNRFYVFLLIITVLLLCSKATFIIFFPLYGLFFLYYFYHKNRKEYIFYAILLLAIGIQTAFLMMHKSESGIPHMEPLPFGTVINKTFFSAWSVFMTVLVRENYPIISWPGVNLTLFLIMSALVLLHLRRLYLKGNNTTVLIFFISSIYIIFAGAFLNINAFTVFYPNQIFVADWSVYMPIAKNRTTFLPLAAFLLGFTVIVINSVSSKILAQILALILILFIANNFSISYFSDAADNYINGNSDWKTYRKLLKDPDYYIPINPENWAMKRNVSVIENTNSNLPDLAGKPLRAIRVLKVPAMLTTTVIAYDSTSKNLVKPERIDSGKGLWLYFYFHEKIQAGAIHYYDSNKKELQLGEKQVIFITSK